MVVRTTVGRSVRPYEEKAVKALHNWLKRGVAWYTKEGFTDEDEIQSLYFILTQRRELFQINDNHVRQLVSIIAKYKKEMRQHGYTQTTFEYYFIRLTNKFLERNYQLLKTHPWHDEIVDIMVDNIHIYDPVPKRMQRRQRKLKNNKNNNNIKDVKDDTPAQQCEWRWDTVKIDEPWRTVLPNRKSN
ncbi:MAG: hypothetical protein ACQ9ET_03005, partial [Nitrosomonadaceae bacterium]